MFFTDATRMRTFGRHVLARLHGTARLNASPSALRRSFSVAWNRCTLQVRRRPRLFGGFVAGSLIAATAWAWFADHDPSATATHGETSVLAPVADLPPPPGSVTELPPQTGLSESPDPATYLAGAAGPWGDSPRGAWLTGTIEDIAAPQPATAAARFAENFPMRR